MSGRIADNADLVLVGGGLANGLIAYRLAKTRPNVRILLLESGATLGGNHTWSFHDSDIDADQTAWLDPFVVRRWPGYDVAFEGFERHIGIGYRSVTSDRFHEIVAAALGPAVRLGAEVAEVEPTGVRLRSGETIRAGAVIDGRGAAAGIAMRFAWQKFVGLELRFTDPHGLAVPILMDATVEQVDGYRFMYVLPIDADTALVEDTYYANGPDLDAATLKRRIADYVQHRGWMVARVLREEAGILPITLGGDIGAFWSGAEGLPRSGLRAGLFHPTTGYSLPDAVRLADTIAGMDDLSAPKLHAATRAASLRHWRRGRFFRALNRMLFQAGPPAERFRMLRRFYDRLPEDAIRRFYAGRLTLRDKLLLVTGTPPVPYLDGARAIMTGA